MDQLDRILNESISRITSLYVAESSSGNNSEYRKFFEKTLKKFGVESPEDLSDSDKKKFFNEIDSGWTSKRERN